MGSQTPPTRKAKDYERQRRDTYGENHKSSRKNVPRHKARLNRLFRRQSKQVLAEGSESTEAAETAEVKVRALRRKQFWKLPGLQLRLFIQRQADRRARENQPHGHKGSSAC